MEGGEATGVLGGRAGPCYLTVPVPEEEGGDGRGADPGVLCGGAPWPPSEPRGPHCPLWGLHLEPPFVLAWVCCNGPAWDAGGGRTTVKECVPVCLPLPALPGTGVSQPR